MFDHLLPVDGHADGAAHLWMTGKIISQLSLLVVGDGRQIEPPVVHGGHGQKPVPGNRLLPVGGRGVGHVRLPGHGRRKRRVLLHKQHRDAVHLRLFAVVIRVRLQNHLLAAVPLHQFIAPGTDGMLSVIRRVGVLRHDADKRHGVGPDGVGAVHMKYHRAVVRRLRIIQHGEIVDGALRLHRVVGERHVLRCQRLAVGEGNVVADCDGPGEAIL